MKLEQVKYNLNKRVLCTIPRMYLENVPFILRACILRACILRETDKGEFYYQAEIQDIKAPHCVLIVKLEDIREDKCDGMDKR